MCCVWFRRIIMLSRMLPENDVSYILFFFFFYGYHADANFSRSSCEISMVEFIALNARDVRLISKLGAPDAMTTSMTTRLRYSARHAFINMCVYMCVRALLRQERSLVHLYEKECESANK